MAVTEQALLAALSSVLDPHTGKDYVSTRALRNLQVTGADVAFDVEMGYPAQSLVPALRGQFEPQGVLLQASTPAQFGSYLRAELQRWAGAVQAARIEPE